MARVVFVTTRLPYPPTEGHQLRSWHLLRAVAREHEVELLSLARRDDRRDQIAALHEIVRRVALFEIPSEHSDGALARAALAGLFTDTPFVVAKYAAIPELRAAVAEASARADLVHFDMLPLMALADAVPPHVPVVFNAHNVEHALLRHRLGVERGVLRRAFLSTQVAKLERWEADAARRARRVLACSPDDAEVLARMAPATPVDVIANGVDVDALQPATGAPAQRDTLVFVGQMSWFPNLDGMRWFLTEVMPRIVAARPAAKLLVIGKAAGLEVPPALAAHVTLAGFVPDLVPPVHDAALYVVPLRAGSGTRLKVLEAMALGKAIVATRIGAEGISLTHGQDVVYADDAGSFAQAVLALLDDPARAARLGAAARRLAEARYGWRAIGEALNASYARALADRPAPTATR